MLGNEIKVILLDIEGTTTSIRFVHDILFPYAKHNVEEYLMKEWGSDEIKQIVRDLQEVPSFEEYKATLADSASNTNIELVTGFVRYLIDKDLKVTPLKTLQGLIWANGYEAGELKGHVYDDVKEAFEHWNNSGLKLAVYSSGSVAAQKLIFENSTSGNLLPYLSAHFDTHVGHKQEKDSYINIAKSLEMKPEHILFLTDIPGEADAARAAGLQAIILQRFGNAPLTDDEKSLNKIINDFSVLKVTK
ncbi:enolase-phosphatase E1 [Drosophila tropicalis]|uniref:enolase-phosphatase E1 n=1 Tax=Drosophila tropicalis TaxID=46794 RepID=UPI0035AC23F9